MVRTTACSELEKKNGIISIYAWMPHQENCYLILGLFSREACIES